MKYNKLLSDYCRWNDHSNVKKLVKAHLDLDLTIKDGLCFIFAIKYQNVEMLKSLLDYYAETKLQGDYDSMEYKTAKYTLRQILEDAIEQYNNVTPEMQEVLTPYVTTADSDTMSLPDLDDILEARWSVDQDDDMDNTIYSLTTSNLRQWTNEKLANHEFMGDTTKMPHDDA